MTRDKGTKAQRGKGARGAGVAGDFAPCICIKGKHAAGEAGKNSLCSSVPLSLCSFGSSPVPARRAAFTLAEVLIALAIFGMMAALLFQTIADVQTALNDARTQSLRQDARRFVTRRALSAKTSSDAQAGGAITLEGGESVAWSAMLEQTELPDLHKLTLTLNWADGTTDTATLQAFRPEWSDAATRSSLLENFKGEYPRERLE